MVKWRISPTFSAVAVIIAFAIAGISFFGVILKNDLVGRLLFGFTWSFIGVWWLGQYIQKKKKSEPANSMELKSD